MAAENRILQINLLNNGTSQPASEVLLSFQPPDKEGRGEIIGISVSTLSSSVFVNIEGRGLFAYTTRGQLLWSAGPVLNQFGYLQGCRKNETDCYFNSVPVLDQCEAAIYVSSRLSYFLSFFFPLYITMADYAFVADFKHRWRIVFFVDSQSSL